MLDTTYQYLSDRGFARGEAKANTGAIADACIAKMLERPVETTGLDEITEKGLLAAELRDLILGTPDDEEVEDDLDALVTRMTAANGPIQNRLENGYVLCSARIQRTLGSNGDTETVSRTARFLSDSPDVIEAFWCAPQADRAVKAALGVKGRWDLAVQRHPEMATRRKAYLSKTQQRLQLELEVGA
jgi:hypothetical protein